MIFVDLIFLLTSKLRSKCLSVWPQNTLHHVTFNIRKQIMRGQKIKFIHLRLINGYFKNKNVFQSGGHSRDKQNLLKTAKQVAT